MKKYIILMVGLLFLFAPPQAQAFDFTEHHFQNFEQMNFCYEKTEMTVCQLQAEKTEVKSISIPIFALPQSFFIFDAKEQIKASKIHEKYFYHQGKNAYHNRKNVLRDSKRSVKI